MRRFVIWNGSRWKSLELTKKYLSKQWNFSIELTQCSGFVEYWATKTSQMVLFATYCTHETQNNFNNSSRYSDLSQQQTNSLLLYALSFDRSHELHFTCHSCVLVSLVNKITCYCNCTLMDRCRKSRVHFTMLATQMKSMICLVNKETASSVEQRVFCIN